MTDLLPTLSDRGFSRFETRLDYGKRPDHQAVYVGRALQGTETSDTSWMVERIDYDIQGRPIRKQAFVGSWDDRTNLK